MLKTCLPLLVLLAIAPNVFACRTNTNTNTNTNTDPARSVRTQSVTTDELTRPEALQALIEAGHLAEAQSVLDGRLVRPFRMPDLPWLLLQARVHGLCEDFLAQLIVYDAVLELEPMHRGARRERILTVLRLGAPVLAEQHAVATPELFTAEELLGFRQFAVGRRIRWGGVEIRDGIGPGRFAATDTALAQSELLDSQFAGLNRDGLAAAHRADFDRLIVLHDRVLMREAIALHGDLQRRGVQLPAYALAAVGGAYLHERQPEMARDLLLQALQLTEREGGHPDPEWQFSLFDAYVDANEPDAARRLIDDLVRDTPPVINPGLKGVEIDNAVYTLARVTAARQRLYADQPRQSQALVDLLVQTAPFNLDGRLVQADLLAARDQPRRARQVYTTILVDDPANMHAAVGVVETALAVNDLRSARAYNDVLTTGYPENPAVRRVQQVVGAYQRPLLVLESRRGRSATGAGVRGNSDFAVESSLYSAPVDAASDPAQWRVYAHTFHSAASFDSESTDRTRFGMGGEYLTDQFSAGVRVSQDDLTMADLGVRLSTSWFPGDSWTVSVDLDSNSNAAPLQAIVAGVEAREISSGIRYSLNESTGFQAGMTHLRFSDHNHRAMVDAQWRQRWISGPVWKLSSRLSAFASANSRVDVEYFNPDRDQGLGLALISEWTPWRRYERAFTHRLEADTSRYWQQGFQTRFGTALRYEHEWQINHYRFVQYGVDYVRQAFDGEIDKSWSLFLNLTWRL